MENLTTRDNQEAVGLLEVFGLVCAFLAADAGCKAANVHLQVFDKNKPANADALPVPLLVTIKFRGSIADVEEAMRAAEAVAAAHTGIVSKYIILRPTAVMLPFRAMHHNIRSGLSCLHEQDISYIVLYGGYAAPNRLEETLRWHGSVVLHIMKRG